MKTLKSILLSALPLFLLGCATHIPAHAQTAQYPGALATDANLKVAVNGVSTLLTQTINNSVTTFSVSSCAGIVANVLITIGSEIMPVSGCSGTVLAVNSRGFDSTSAASHATGSVIYAYVDAWHHNSLSKEVEAVETALGANLSNVLSSASLGACPSGQAVTAINNGTAPTCAPVTNTFNTRSGTVTLNNSDVSTAVGQGLTTTDDPVFDGVTGTTTVTAGKSSTTNTGHFVALDQSGSGHYSWLYRNADSTCLWDSVLAANTLCYDQIGAVSISGTLGVAGAFSAGTVTASTNYRAFGHTFIDTGGYRVIGGTAYVIDNAQNGFFNNVTINGTCTGCAGSALTVPVVVSGTSASPALSVTNLGAGGGIAVAGGTATDTLSVLGQADISIVHGTTRFSLGTHTFVDSGGYRVIGGTAYVIDSSQNGFLNNLTVTGTCTGCGGGGLTVPATLTGSSASPAFTITNTGAGGGIAVTGGSATDTLTASGIITGASYKRGASTVIDSSSNGSFAALAITGAFTGTHAQNVGTGDNPSFNILTTASSIVSNGLTVSSGGITSDNTTIGLTIGGTTPVTSDAIIAHSTKTAAGSMFHGIDGNGVCLMNETSGLVCSSDRRLKKNIVSLSSGLDVIKALRPVTFLFKKEAASVRPHPGFIAQEVQKVLPGAVQVADEGMLALAKDDIIPYLVRAIQEQQAEIDELKRQIATGGR